LVSINASNNDNLMIQLYKHNTGSPLDRIRAVGYGSGATVFRTRLKLQTLSVGTWYAITGVFTNSTTYEIYVDAAAGNENLNTGTVTLATLTQFDVGSFRAGAGTYGNGDIAEVAVWDAALTVPEITSLAARVSPQQIRPGNLVAYAPLMGKSSPEPELVSGLSLTLTNTPAEAVHPRVFRPSMVQRRMYATAATAPTITALSAINITATSAQPRISYS
jgi:hypothetical protein